MSQPLTRRPPAPVARSPLAGVFPRSLFPRGLFDDFLDQYVADANGEVARMVNVSMDVSETPQAFEVRMDLPGIRPEEVDIQIDSNTLTIRGQRNEETAEQDEERQYHRIERYSGSFARSVVLPTSINEDETAAEFKDGVLKIVIPKTEDARPRKISISG